MQKGDGWFVGFTLLSFSLFSIPVFVPYKYSDIALLIWLFSVGLAALYCLVRAFRS